MDRLPCDRIRREVGVADYEIVSVPHCARTYRSSALIAGSIRSSIDSLPMPYRREPTFARHHSPSRVVLVAAGRALKASNDWGNRSGQHVMYPPNVI